MTTPLAHAHHTATGLLQEIGEVASHAHDGFTVDAPSGRHVLRRAVNCLVEPQVGDLVLIAIPGESPALKGTPPGVRQVGSIGYVLAVLESGEPGPTRISAAGDLEIAPKGRLRMHAPEGVTVRSEREVAIEAGKLTVAAALGDLCVEGLNVLGTALSAEFAHIKTVAESSDGVFGRVAQRVQRMYRSVEEIEQVRAQRMDLQVRSVFSVRGKQTLVTAKELAKIDGEQVHIG